MEQALFQETDVREAYERIQPYIRRTPLEKSFYLSSKDQNVFLKLECAQSVKSFKIRGALNKMLQLSEEERQKGVVTVSSGNHGISVSYGAQLLGIERADIIVPTITPQSKVDKIGYYGGNAILIGENYDAAHAEGMKYVKEHEMVFIDGWDNDPAVYAGQGTIGLEILEQNPEIDTILVPIGGGGMATGTAVAAKAIKPGIRVIGLQTAACPAMVRSIEDHTCYGEYPTEPSICEALVGGIGRIAFAMREIWDDILVIEERFIEEATAFAVKKEKIVAEPSGAICIAALLQDRSKIPGRNVALIISGGNVDENLLTDLMQKY